MTAEIGHARNQPFGILALTGFIAEGLTLDAQVYRTFAFAVAMAVIWHMHNKENKPDEIG